MNDDLDRRLDPSALDPSRGLVHLACDWALFGLALDPDAWLGASPEAQHAIAKVWLGEAGSRGDDPGVFHGLIVGARAHLRELRRAGVHFRNRSWADLGGESGHYAIALMIEGASDAELIVMRAPGPLARAALDLLRVHVRLGDPTLAKVPFTDGVLALCSVDPEPVVLASPGVETVVFAPAGGRGASHLFFDTRVISWTSRFAMVEGCCALRDEPQPTSTEVRERSARAPGLDRRREAHCVRAAFRDTERHPSRDGPMRAHHPSLTDELSSTELRRLPPCATRSTTCASSPRSTAASVSRTSTPARRATSGGDARAATSGRRPRAW